MVTAVPNVRAVLVTEAGVPYGAANPVPVSGSNPVTLTDSSGTIATGGTSQAAANADTSRRYLQIANPDTSRDLYFNTTGAAAIATAGSTMLGPGACVIWEVAVPTGAVWIIGAVTGQPFTVKVG